MVRMAHPPIIGDATVRDNLMKQESLYIAEGFFITIFLTVREATGVWEGVAI